MIAPWMMVIVGCRCWADNADDRAAAQRERRIDLYGWGSERVLIVRQLVTVPLHLNLPPLFAGPVIWLMNNKPFVRRARFRGIAGSAVLLAAALPLAAQYLLKRAEV